MFVLEGEKKHANLYVVVVTWSFFCRRPNSIVFISQADELLIYLLWTIDKAIERQYVKQAEISIINSSVLGFKFAKILFTKGKEEACLEMLCCADDKASHRKTESNNFETYCEE